MSANFIAQPSGTFRIGDFLKQGFADPRWTEFRAAVAFVKRSGTKHIRDTLEAFSVRGASVRIAAGIDAGGTSAEGLAELMSAVAGRGTVFVFKNAGSSTFHPKMYLFRNDASAEIVIGSGNLTEGGLFTNYEASLLLRLDLADDRDAALLRAISATLDNWSTPTPSLCYALDSALLAKLVEEGYVPDETRAWGDEKIAEEEAQAAKPGLFARHAVAAAPKAPGPTGGAPEGADEQEEPEDDEGLQIISLPPVAAQGGTYKVFLMTLQKTDVGIGQTTKGTSRRSPEIFIPLVARNYDPEFWGWPDLFVEDSSWTGPVDRDGRAKMDRSGVMVRLGGATFPVHFWYNPDKKDLRLRSEDMRSAGSIGDILYFERSNGTGGFAYYADVVPQGSPRHAELLVKCTNTVRSSKKVFGYL